MFGVSARTLKMMASLVWYSGGFVLLLKGRSLLSEAEALRPGQAWPWVAAGGGLLLGAVQARTLFLRSGRKNLRRIAALGRPRAWQFFRPGFFGALAVMIAAGATMSRLAHGNYPFLLFVAGLDLAVAVSLLGSSTVFWERPDSDW